MSPTPILRRRRSVSLTFSVAIVACCLGSVVACKAGPRPTPETAPPEPSAPPISAVELAGTVAITVGDHVLVLPDWKEEDLPQRLLLRSADGRPLAEAEPRPRDLGWEARLRDSAGEPVALAPGLRLWAELGGQPRELVRIPDWTWAFDREAGRLSLRSRSGAVDADSEHAFSLRLAGTGSAGELDALPADPRSFAWDPTVLTNTQALTLALHTEQERLRIRWPRRRPFVRVSLLPGDIMGHLAPGATITVTLQRGDSEGRGIAQADDNGSFTAWAYDASGRRLVPRPGDRVAASDGATTLAVEVPEFSAAWSVEDGRLAGRGPAGAGMDFTLWNPWRPGETETPDGAVEVGGDWGLLPTKGLHPATHFYITTHLPFGDQLYYCQQIPMLYVEPGDGKGGSPRASTVEVQALWEVSAQLDLLRGGKRVAGATGGGPWSGNLELTLRDEQGQAARMLAGDRLRITAEGQTMEMEIAAFDASFAGGDAQELVGQAPEGARIRLANPENPFPEPATVAEGGRWRLASAPLWQLAALEPLPGGLPALAPGERVEAFTSLPSGHNLRRRFGGPRVEATLGEAGFRVILPEGMEPAALRVERAGERLALSATPTELTWGQAYSVTLGSAPDAAGGLRAADRLQLQTAVGRPLWSSTLPSLEAGLVGTVIEGAPQAEGLMDIEVFLAPGEPPLRYAVQAAEGPWRLDLLRPPAGQAIAPPEMVRRVDLVWNHEGVSLRRHLGRPGPPVKGIR